jgi:hypothetical protein
MILIDTYRIKDSCMYIVVLSTKKIGFHTTGNSTSLSAFGSILKIFLEGTSVDKCEGHILG